MSGIPPHLHASKIKSECIRLLELRKFPINIELPKNINQCIVRQIIKELKKAGYRVSLKTLTEPGVLSDDGLIIRYEFIDILTINKNDF